MPFAGAVTAVIAVLVGLPALRVPGPLPGREHPGLRLCSCRRGAGHPLLDRARRGQDAVHRTAQPPVHAHRRPDASSGSSLASARVLRLVLAGRAGAVGRHGPGVARPGRGPPADGRPGQRDRGRRPWASRWPGPSCWPSPSRASWPATPACAWPSPPSGSPPPPSTRPSPSWSSRWWSSGGWAPSTGPCSGPSTWWASRPSSAPPDHPVPHQRHRSAGLHPLPARGPGRPAPPLRRPGHPGPRAAAVPTGHPVRTGPGTGDGPDRPGGPDGVEPIVGTVAR